MRRKQLSLPQKVFVVKNYYQRCDMSDVRSVFDRTFKLETTDSVLEIFFKLVSEFERTGQVTQSVFYEGTIDSKPEVTVGEEDEPKQPKKRGRKPKVKVDEEVVKDVFMELDKVQPLPSASDFKSDPTEVTPEAGTIVIEAVKLDNEWAYKIELPEVVEEEEPIEEDYTEIEYATEDLAEEEEELYDEEEAEDTETPPPRKKRSRSDQGKAAKKKRIVCIVCERSYCPEFINSHMKKHDRDGHSYECTDCDEEFNNYVAFRIHSESHIPVHKYQFQCVTCQEKFVSQDRLNLHQKDHAPSKQFCCEWCGMIFSKSESLKVHMRTHTGEKPLKCLECHESFAFYGTLKSHMKKHTGGDYKCNYCDKVFVYKAERNLHHREHTGTKPYVCHVCNRGCPAPHNLRSHLKILHKIEMSLEDIQAQNYVGALDSALNQETQ